MNLKAPFKELALQYQTFINENSDLTMMIDVNNPWSDPQQTNFEKTLLHVSNHGTYHLGNITIMLRQ